MASLSPTTAPISASAGRSGSAGLATGTITGWMRGPATARGGGRREAEKIGRSCVAVSTESGTDQSGFPLTGSLRGIPLRSRQRLQVADFYPFGSPGDVVRQDVQRCRGRGKGHGYPAGRQDQAGKQRQTDNLGPRVHFLPSRPSCRPNRSSNLAATAGFINERIRRGRSAGGAGDPRARAGAEALCNLSGLQMLPIGTRRPEIRTSSRPKIAAKRQAPLRRFREP